MSAESFPRPRIGIFRGADEIANLVCPFAVSLFLYILFRWRFSPGDFYVYLFVNVLLFNVTHVALAMFSTAYLPESRGWLAEHSRRDKGVLFAESAAALALIVAFMFWSAGLPSARVFGISLDGWQACIIMGASTQHILRQSYGLSVMYSHQIRRELKLEGEELEAWHRSVLREKRLFSIFEPVVLAQGIGLIKGIYVHLQIVLFWLFVLAGVLAVLMMLNAYFLMPGGRRSNKAMFLTRMGIHPIQHLSVPLMLGAAAMHGIEYLFVWRQVRSRSAYRPTRSSRAVFWLLVAGICGLGLGMTPGGRITAQAVALFGSAKMVMFFSRLSGTFTYFHYFFDRKVYRMKSARSRKWIAPLLEKAADEPHPADVNIEAFALAADPV